MTYQVDYQHIKRLMGLHDRNSHVIKDASQLTHILSLGVLSAYEAEGALAAAGVSTFYSWSDIARMAAALDMDNADPVKTVWVKPRKLTGDTTGVEGISAEDFVATLVVLARYGVAINPKPWIDALPRLDPAVRFVSRARLTIFRFPYENENYKINLFSYRPVEEPPLKRVIEKAGFKITIDATEQRVSVVGKKTK
jgi:hypothetical protein